MTHLPAAETRAFSGRGDPALSGSRRSGFSRQPAAKSICPGQFDDPEQCSILCKLALHDMIFDVQDPQAMKGRSELIGSPVKFERNDSHVYLFAVNNSTGGNIKGVLRFTF
jgi:hypothetical protein